MKSLLHRINQLSNGEQARLKRSRRGQPEETLPPQAFNPDVLEGFMRGMIGLALNDPETMQRRRSLWVNTKVGRPPYAIPQQAGKLEGILKRTYKSFRMRLRFCGEGDRWASYSLSFMAMRRCARIGKPMDLAYICRSCQNAHKKFIAKHAPRQRIDIEVSAVAIIPSDIETIDLELDIEAALQRLDPIDARIVRMWCKPEATFHQIGAALGVHESTANRRFKKALDALRMALRAYQPEGDRPDTIDVAGEPRRSAA